MKYTNKLKRIADVLEKLGVAGVALGIFQSNYSGIGLAMAFLVASIVLTQEK